MFSIKDGKVVADFGPELGSVTLALDEVKVDVKELALIALQRVSRETVAGKATDAPAEARKKLLTRWELWKQGKWETERSKAVTLSDAEKEAIAWDVFEFFAKAAGKPEARKVAEALVAKGDKKAVERWTKFKADHSKAIATRIKETIKIRKQGAGEY